MIPVGTSVLLKKLKKHGKIVECLSDGSYKVAIGSITMRVKEADLIISAQPEKKVIDQPIGPVGIEITSDATGKGSTLRRLDLHGMTVDEALRTLEEHLSRSIMANISEVEVMHGLGSGKLKDAIVKHLGTLPVVKGTQPHPFNRGVTRVFI